MTIDILARILNKLLSSWATTLKNVTTRQSNNADHDVTITKDEESYFLYFTICETSDENFKEDVEEIFSGTLYNTVSAIETVTAYIKQTENEKEMVCESEHPFKEMFTVNIDTRKSSHLAHLKVYQSIRFKCRLSSSDIGIFKKEVTALFKRLRVENTNVRYTLNDRTIEHNVKSAETIALCQLMSTAIAAMIKHTLNDKFRERALTLIGKNHSSNIEDTLLQQFLSLSDDNHKVQEDDEEEK